MGTLGLEVDTESLRSYLFPGTKEVWKYLVDENGVIVLSYPGRYEGFIGHRYPYLMRTLIRKGLYDRIKYWECIHTCHMDKRSDIYRIVRNAASPTPTLLTIIKFVVNSILSLIKTVIYYSHQNQGFHDTPYHFVDCCKQYNQYQRNSNWTSFKPLTIERWCGGECYSRLTVSGVALTNMMLVVDNTPACTCPYHHTDSHGGARSLADDVTACSEDQGDSEYYVNFQTCALSNVTQHVDTCSTSATVRAQRFVLFNVLLTIF